jgi:hypothetical protein
MARGRLGKSFQQGPAKLADLDPRAMGGVFGFLELHGKHGLGVGTFFTAGRAHTGQPLVVDQAADFAPAAFPLVKVVGNRAAVAAAAACPVVLEIAGQIALAAMFPAIMHNPFVFLVAHLATAGAGASLPLMTEQADCLHGITGPFFTPRLTANSNQCRINKQ